MITPKTSEDLLPRVSALHYVALCGLCLAMIFLAQMQQGLHPLTNLLGVMVGILGLVSKLRLGPILLIIFVSAAQMHYQMTLGRFFVRLERTLEITDIVLGIALLGFVATHYRLQTVWLHMLPFDPRQRSGPARRTVPWFRKRSPLLAQKRAPEQITPFEIAALVLTLPICALAALILWSLVPMRWEALGLPYRLVQIVLFSWLIGVGFFIARTLLTYWRERQWSPQEAEMHLQDVLWKQTRGEQRRVNRWLAWFKLGKHDNV